MADSKVFNLNGLTVLGVAQAIETFFEERKGLLSEVVETPNGIIVQAKQKETWKKLVGMDNSVQVQLFDQGETAIVNVGSGKWIDKAGAATVGAFVFAPLAVTAAIGAWANKKLPDEVFDCVERYILSGGKTIGVSMNMSSALKANEVLCPKCKTKNPEGTVFCGSCGEKLVLECGKCGAVAKPGTKFCPACGSNLLEEQQKAIEASIIKCSSCGTAILGGAKFCPECGASAPVPLEEGMAMCPKCRKILPDTTKFCPDCGGAIPQKAVPKCAGCGAVVPAGVKFCPECGKSMLS